MEISCTPLSLDRRIEVDANFFLAQTTLTTGAGDSFVFLFTVFVLAVFVGFYVVWSVTPALHSP
ncbi:MAG TPA: hypothetical protein EYN55_09095, partial [Rhodospirillales bacterium]|nr:hypothetical protein [Rhodospirillales bacterium]